MVNSTSPSNQILEKDSHITEMDNTVYVPSSPFNIILPQRIITNLNTKENLDVYYATQDEIEYITSFKNKHLWLPYRSLTIPIRGNGIFHLLTTPGYTSFYTIASTFQCYEYYYSDNLIPD